MGKLGIACLIVLTLPVWLGDAAAADSVGANLDAARTAYGKNDLAGAARALENALADIHKRLGKSLAETLPPPFAGWQAEEVEIQGLGQAGGGPSVSRSYVKGDSSLSASLLLDSPAAEPTIGILSGTSTLQAVNSRRVRIGAEEALLRFDSSTKTGEISMVVGNRVLLEIEADNVANADVLIEAAKGWNIVKIKSLLW